MSPVLVDVTIAALSVALYAVAYAGTLLVTRPARVSATPATPELGDEPPAVVSLLANRWRLTEDASESTLLDLAARGYLELRQPGNDPRHTTVHLRDTQPAESLLPYEHRVLARVRDLAVQGVIPVTALTFRNQQQAHQWNRRLHREVANDARARGLSRRRLSATVVGVLSAVAALSAVGIGLVVLRASTREDEVNVGGAFWAAVIAFLVLSGIAARPHGERDTRSGRQVAAGWLGVRAWLRGHEEFAGLPPAAVTVWDRYLSYGAALGATHTASEVLDLGLGDRRLVWSSYGGAWRRVRVRYPRLWRRYGQPVPRLLWRAVLAVSVGALLLWLIGQRPPEPDQPAPAGLLDLLRELAGSLSDGLLAFHPVGRAVAGVLLGYGGYVLVRTLLDLPTTRTLTGQVLWIELWRSHHRKNQGSVPWLDYLALDEGHRDRTRAWALPRGLAPDLRDGDVVTLQVRPWSRRVVAVRVVERGRSHTLTDAPVEEDTGELGRGLLSALGVSRQGSARSPGVTPAELLSADEVGRALGVPVRPPQALPVPGPFPTAIFATVERERQVLLVGVASGRPGQWVWRRASRGTPLPGVGDGAFVDGDRGAVRVGDATVTLTLVGPARGRRDHLPWLLQQVARRLPRDPGTAPEPPHWPAAPVQTGPEAEPA